MICYRIVTLTDPEDFSDACTIEVRYGTKVIGLCGEMVRDFVRCVHNAYATSQYVDALGELLKSAPSEIHPILRHLYSEMKDKI